LSDSVGKYSDILLNNRKLEKMMSVDLIELDDDIDEFGDLDKRCNKPY
jgi:Uri superfamily endonuclease